LRSHEKIDMLESISPIDGRYREKLSECASYLSEYALMKRRLLVEVTYLQCLADMIPELMGKLPQGWAAKLDEIPSKFTLEEAIKVKDLESKLGHDVYAVIEYLRHQLKEMYLEVLIPYVHIGLTSEDINNIAYSSLMRDFVKNVYLPELLALISKLVDVARTNKSVALMARTHGQPAVPTTFGRFVANYAHRLGRLAAKLAEAHWYGKIGGAVGDLGSLRQAYPDVDWKDAEIRVLGKLGLKRYPANTQVLPGEVFTEPIHLIVAISNVLSNMSRDFWLLGMLGLLRFEKDVDRIHSSTMPQKTNPLYLENAEGALDLTSEILSYISRRIISSRLHRDLSDSILKRFYGVGLATALLGVKSMRTALTRITVDVNAMTEEVRGHPEILSESLQVLLRRHGVAEGYELAMEACEKGLEWLSRRLVELGLEPEKRLKILETSLDEYLQASIRLTDELLGEAQLYLNRVREMLDG
jgi:adenylosuccinate lyase